MPSISEEEARRGSQTRKSVTLQTVPKAAIKNLQPKRVQDLHKLAGYAVYCGARPFNLFKEPNMRAFITSLEPAYTPPDRGTIGGKLLIECYNETRAEVLEIIRRSQWINVSIDESFDKAIFLEWSCSYTLNRRMTLVET
jgi:hypothetical protein